VATAPNQGGCGERKGLWHAAARNNGSALAKGGSQEHEHSRALIGLNTIRWKICPTHCPVTKWAQVSSCPGGILVHRSGLFPSADLTGWRQLGMGRVLPPLSSAMMSAALWTARSGVHARAKLLVYTYKHEIDLTVLTACRSCPSARQGVPVRQVGGREHPLVVIRCARLRLGHFPTPWSK
jgi:hypothetical protein